MGAAVADHANLSLLQEEEMLEVTGGCRPRHQNRHHPKRHHGGCGCGTTVIIINFGTIGAIVIGNGNRVVVNA